jgi:hypothetical protein
VVLSTEALEVLVASQGFGASGVERTSLPDRDSLASPPATKFGLTETQRKRIYREMVAIEDRAQREADARIPLDGAGDVRDRLLKNIQLMRELKAKYRKQLFAAQRITEEQAESIAVEAAEKNWPLPSPKR